MSAPDIHSIDYHDGVARRSAARLLASSVPVECHGLVAYHASGWDAFLAAALAPAPGQRTVCLRAATFDGEVIAVADWRILSGQLFLNGLSVRAQYRGLGLGTQLLGDGLRIARDLGICALGLDVSVDNTGAHALYRKLGFEEMGYSWWENVTPVSEKAAFPCEKTTPQYAKAPSQGVKAPPQGAGPAREQVRILDWPGYEAHRAAYGFGDLSVRYSGGQVTKVRTVGGVMRVDPGASGALIAHALEDLVAPSRVYAIRAGAAAGGTAWFARFVRMRMSLRGAGLRFPARRERRSARWL
jgi:GNAT superfamily N-acetyltransferase